MRIRVSPLRLLMGLSLIAGLSACTEPMAAHLAGTAGGTQTVAMGAQAPTPLTVTVRDYYGEPVEGVEISWKIQSGSGSLSSATTTTGDDGTTSVTYTAGTTTGRTSIAASQPLLGSAVNFTMIVQ